jgi:2-oxoglutarate dehydrogenase E1 component
MNLSEMLSKDYIDSQYEQWKADPNSVTRDWQSFFEGFEMGLGMDRKADAVFDEKQVLKQSRVGALIRRYREIGHLLACLDPLTSCPTDHPLLNLSTFNLTQEDLDTKFYAEGLIEPNRVSLKDIINTLKETYCRSIGVEFMHLQDPEERKWLQKRMEPVRNKPDLKPDDKLRIMEKLYRATLFEQFLHKKYLGQTRFSLEGAEAVIPMLDVLTERAASQGCREIILGMAHRGRLNIQANILNKSFEDIFTEFESCYDPDEVFGTGDVKYHNGYLADIKTRQGELLRIFLVNNPSHLESVNPVVQGFVRARLDILGEKCDFTPSHPWRCCFFRTGRGNRDPEHVPAHRIQNRWHHPSGDQQSDRLYNTSRTCPIYPLCNGCGQDADGSDFSCPRRRSGSRC